DQRGGTRPGADPGGAARQAGAPGRAGALGSEAADADAPDRRLARASAGEQEGARRGQEGAARGLGLTPLLEAEQPLLELAQFLLELLDAGVARPLEAEAAVRRPREDGAGAGRLGLRDLDGQRVGLPLAHDLQRGVVALLVA